MILEDLLLIFSIGIENIQLLMIGPDFSDYNPIFHSYGKYFSLSIIDIYDWEFSIFWALYKAFLVISFL